MTGAIALAIVLLIAVVGASMAMESQKAQGQPAVRRTPRPARPEPGPPRRPRLRDRARSEAPPPPPPPPAPPSPPEAEFKAPDLLRAGVAAQARVVSVVDERTIGPVTRSRLVLRIEPGGDAAPFEVTVRHAFQTPDARAAVKVGGVIDVRYDPDDHRVVLDQAQD